jgi:hypothetical protein
MKLVERSDGEGLAAAVEILRRTPRVSKLIQEGNLQALEEEIESSVSYHKMQSTNQSLAALVLNRAITTETALNNSSNPGDLDLILRKFLFAAQQNPLGEMESNDMAEPLGDFSKILELQEIKQRYDEQNERHSGELAERDAEIARLKEMASQQTVSAQVDDGQVEQLQQEKERLAKQVQFLRGEYEAKIERLNARIRELTGGGGRSSEPVEAERRGFFRR